MNHISKSFALRDGRSCKSHSWELREGGYGRIALFVGNGLWPAAKETRVLDFLLDRRFRVLSLDLSFGSMEAPRLGLRAYRDAVADFARANVDPDLPFYLLASSFSAGALLPVASSLPGLAALALVAPVVDFPPPRLKSSCFLRPSAELAIGPEDLCGEGELASALVSGGLMRPRASLSFRKRDLRTAATDLAAALAGGFAVPVAAFSGEDDPFISAEGRAALSGSGAKLYSYPRTRHEPGRDRYADNFFADLGYFLGEAESTGSKKRD
jgi:alpha-beta hydrolase superfamily lysophospholipase